jgi:hypothetical protein
MKAKVVRDLFYQIQNAGQEGERKGGGEKFM